MTIAAEQPRSGALLRILGVSFGIAVGVGMMIGSGILRSPTTIAGLVPNANWIIALWVLGAVHAALGANILAELGTSMPQAGGPYVYAHRGLGDIGGLLVGWTNWLSTLAGIAAASVSFANFLVLLWPETAEYSVVTAVAMQGVVYGANLMGLREGRVLQLGTSLIKCVMLLAFALAAVAIGARSSLGEIARAGAPAAGAWALIGAYQLIRGAYAGWDAPVYFAEENSDPSRSVPRALFIGIAVTTLLYVGVNAALLWSLGTAGTARTVLPFTTVLMHFGGNWPAIFFAFGAMITVASCANANIMSAPRILFALSRDRLLPRALLRVNSGGTPDLAFIMTAVCSILLAVTGGFATVFGMIATLNSVAGLLVGIAFFVLRMREPALARPFRAWAYPVLPALAVAIDAVLLALFLRADLTGAAVCVAMTLLCIPFALVARAARQD